VTGGSRFADFNENQSCVRAAESKPMVANRHDARTAGSHHPHGTTGTQTHFAQPMDVVRLSVDLQNGSALSRCKVVQRHNLAANGSNVRHGQALHGEA
jgi:hypothetical protein